MQPTFEDVFPILYKGWDPAAARADFNAGGWTNKAGASGITGSSGSSFQPISLDDFAKLEEQAFQLVKPYYEKLAKESRGDFNRAKLALEEDYRSGVRQAKQEAALTEARQKEDLTNSLKTLGITFGNEQEAAIDALNRRGMATFEGQTGLRANVPTMTSDATTVTPLDTSLTGRGGTEYNRILENQKLRAEATQRATQRTLEDLGISLKKVTNAPAGDVFNPNADRSMFGSKELALVRGTEDLTRSQQLNEQNLAERRRAEAGNIAKDVASLQGRSINEKLQNQYQKGLQTDFINSGLS